MSGTLGAVTIIHAADIHLDSPLRGLGRLGDDRLAGRLRLATRTAFVNLVDFTLREAPDALVLAGDIYDGDWQDYATGRFFVEQMDRLDAAGIPVITAAGNHDADSVITRALTLPKNVHVMSTTAPETWRLDDAGVAFHGQGFATRAVLQNLARHYPEPIPDLVNVGILHTSIAGYDNHDLYAPCTVADLQATGYEYFALGHVHTREVVCEGHTTAAFSGNLQDRHVHETGPKGAYVVTLRAGKPAELNFEPLDVARWEHLTLDVGEAADLNDVLNVVQQALTKARQDAEDRPVVARLTLTGVSEAAAALTDSERLENEVDLIARRLDVAVESVRNRTRPPAPSLSLSAADLAALYDIAGSAGFAAAAFGGERWSKLANETTPLLRRLGLAAPDPGPDPGRDALQLLLARFAGGIR